MRIVMLNDYFGHSAGAFAVAWALSGELIRRGHEVAFVCATEDRSEVGTKEVEGRLVELIYARTPERARPLLSLHRPGLARRAARRVLAFKPDVVHAFVMHLHLSLGLLARLDRAGLPVVMMAQDTGIFCPTKYTCAPPEDPARPATMAKCLACRRLRWLPGRASAGVRLVNRHVHRVAAASDSLAGILKANGLQNVTTIRAGLDPELYRGQGWSGAQFRKHLGLVDEPLIFFGGRLQFLKGDQAALKGLAASDPAFKAKLVIAGRKELFSQKLKALAEELGLAGRIVLAGWLDRDQIMGAYRACMAAMVLSLYPDPFPTINLEAMTLGLPVVGTAFGGTPEVVVDGKTGFVIDPRQPEQIGRALNALLADPGKARALGRAGKARLVSEFSLSAQAEKVETMYHRAVER